MGEIKIRFRPVDLLIAVLLIAVLSLLLWEGFWRAPLLA